jgi:putative cell wall-binding protein
LRTPFKRFSKSLVAGVAAGALAISGLAVVFTASPAGAVTTTRVGGANRYDTARLAALANFPGGSSTVILASGENFPDGLSASTLAGAMGVPLLLTPTAALAAETVSALATLHAHTVQIVGGPAAVSAGVIAQLTGLGYTVPAAIAGADRFATSAAVATAAAASAPVGTIGGAKTAIIATGLNFPDALSAGSAAYFAHLPILLTDSATLSPTVGPAVTALGIKNALIMGGPAAISAAVETSIKALNGGITTTRVAGATRFETAADMATLDIAPAFSGGLAMSAANIVLASGLNFPDALVAAEFKAPIVLDGAGLPMATSTFLSTNAALISTITAIGGPAAVADADLAAAANAVSPVAGAATFAAVAGGTSFTVTFGAPVNTPLTLGVGGNFLLNNAAFGGNVQQTGAASFLVWGIPLLKPGDVIAINGANPPTAASNGAKVPVSSLTVGANAAPAVASVNYFVGGHSVTVTFSKPVALNGGVSCTAVCTSAGVVAGGAGLSQDGTTFRFTTGAANALGDTLNISVAVTDLSAGAVHLPAAASFAPAANTVPPTVAVAAHNTVTSATTHGSYQLAGAGFAVGANVVVVSAKPGGAADGALGGSFHINSAAPAGPASPLVVTTATAGGITTVTLSYGGPGVYANGAALAAALNANAVFNAVLVANGTGAGAIGPTTTVVAGNPLVGGTTTTAMAVVLSKQVDPTNTGVPGNWTVSSGAFIGAPIALNVSSAPSALTIVFVSTTPAEVIVPGTTTLNFTGAAPISDFAGNVMVAGSFAIS